MYRTFDHHRLKTGRLGHSGQVPRDELSHDKCKLKRGLLRHALSAYAERRSGVYAQTGPMACDVHS
jgi:hypothetical protein